MSEEKEIRAALFLAIDLSAIRSGVSATFEKEMYVGQEKIHLTVRNYYIGGEDIYNLLIECRGKQIQPAVMLNQEKFIAFCKLRNIDLSC